MKANRMWGAAAIVAGMLVAQSVMAGPIRELEPIERGWGVNAHRGQTQTEPARELEPVEAPGAGGASAMRGWVALEWMQIGRFGTLVSFDVVSIRRALLGR